MYKQRLKTIHYMHAKLVDKRNIHTYAYIHMHARLYLAKCYKPLHIYNVLAEIYCMA